MEAQNVLNPIPVIALHQSNFFGYINSLLWCAESNDACNPRVCFLIAQSCAHASAHQYIISNDISTTVINNSDVPQIICEDINIISGRDSNGNLELDGE